MTVVEEHASPDVIVMILGNKADMNGERVVKTEQGERLAKVIAHLFGIKGTIRLLRQQKLFSSPR